MENAGIGLARHIRHFLIAPTNKCKIIMLCGTGNNGGDAFAAARHLVQSNLHPEIFLVGEETSMKEEAAVNFRIIKKLGVKVEPVDHFEKKQKEWSGTPVLIVDAIMGIGFKSPLRPTVQGLIKELNRFKKFHNCAVKILAVDIPSGLDGDEGPQSDDIIRADVTVSFACSKKGMVKPESRPYVGRVEVVDIGIPEALFQGERT